VDSSSACVGTGALARPSQALAKWVATCPRCRFCLVILSAAGAHRGPQPARFSRDGVGTRRQVEGSLFPKPSHGHFREFAPVPRWIQSCHSERGGTARFRAVPRSRGIFFSCPGKRYQNVPRRRLSRGAAEDHSPRRKPWVQSDARLSPGTGDRNTCRVPHPNVAVRAT